MPTEALLPFEVLRTIFHTEKLTMSIVSDIAAIQADIATLKKLTTAIDSAVEGPLQPLHASVRVGDAGPGLVTVTATWDAPPVGDSTVSYQLQIVPPSGSALPAVTLAAPATSYVTTLTDDTGTWSLTLASFNSAGVSCPTPAVKTFVPHVAPPPPPPPPAPSNPTNLNVAVTP